MREDGTFYLLARGSNVGRRDGNRPSAVRANCHGGFVYSPQILATALAICWLLSGWTSWVCQLPN